MEKIVHRVNTLQDLQSVPRTMGVEVDLRSRGNEIIMNHGPFCDGEKFSEFCRHYRHGTMVVNPKEDGLEGRAMEMLKENGVKNYFFLDLAMPTMVRLSNAGESRMAVRFSKFEPLEAVLAMEGRADWVWVDCFDGFFLDEKSYGKMEGKFKICLVSPELQKYPKTEILAHKKRISEIGAKVDAVCTDCPQMW